MVRYEQFKQHIQTDVTPEAIRYLAHNMRPADTQEAEAAHGFPFTPEVWEGVLENSVNFSTSSRIILEDDLKTPLGIYGVMQNGSPGLGVLWMHCTPALTRHRHSFLKLGHYALEELQDQYKQLVCYADSRNTVHTHWLRWLGFFEVSLTELADPDVDFIVFVLPGRKGVCAHV